MSTARTFRSGVLAEQYPSALPLLRAPLRGKALAALQSASVLSALDFGRPMLTELFALAALLETGRLTRRRGLAGKIILTAFFEPSTRTRLSFESAALRLGGQVISVADGTLTSVRKGESIADTGVMFGCYADIIVFRHSRNSALEELLSIGCAAAVVNAGNGMREHPTQALADWYVLLKWRAAQVAKLSCASGRLSIAMVGDLSTMRTLRSFLLLGASCFPDYIKEVALIGDHYRQVDIADVTALLDRMRIRWSICREQDVELAQFDVIYINSLVPDSGGYRPSSNTVRLSRASPLKPSAVILHPLARQSELSTDLDATPHNLYFAQAAGAVFVRQALLLALAGRAHKVVARCVESQVL